VLIGFHFALPLLLLLARRRKESIDRLARIAVMILVMRWIDLYWLIAPAFSPGRLQIHWLDLTLLVGIGGVWLYLFARKLGAWPLLPVNDPRLAEALDSAEGHA